MAQPGTRVLVGLSAALLLLAGASGCAKISGKCSIAGKVTYKGTPLVYGTVMIQAADRLMYTADIQPDGTYANPEIPAGNARIAVVSPEPPPPAAKILPRGAERPGAKPATVEEPKYDRSKWVKLPTKYENVMTSELTCTIKTGANTHDVEMQ